MPSNSLYLMHRYQERDGADDRKPVQKTCVKEIWRRTFWTGHSGRMIFITIPATPDDGKSLRRRRREDVVSRYLSFMLCTYLIGSVRYREDEVVDIELLLTTVYIHDSTGRQMRLSEAHHCILCCNHNSRNFYGS